MSLKYRVSLDIAEIESLLQKRVAPTAVPESWRDRRFAGLNHDMRHTLINDIEIDGGRSTFGNKPVRIKIGKAHNFTLGSSYYSDQFEIENARVGYRNISVGGVGVAEHPASLGMGLGLRAEISLDAGSFPQFGDGLGPVIDELAGNLVAVGKRNFHQVVNSIAVIFSDDCYIIAEPPRSSKEGLIVDNQYHYRDSALGSLRMQMEITPERYAFLASACTLTYGFWADVLNFCKSRFSIPYLGMNLENTVAANHSKFYNAKVKFEITCEGGAVINGEPMAHEFVDKLGSVMMDFKGRLTFSKTNHLRDVIAMREIKKYAVLAASKDNS